MRKRRHDYQSSSVRCRFSNRQNVVHVLMMCVTMCVGIDMHA